MNIQHHDGVISPDMMNLLLSADPDEAVVQQYLDNADILTVSELNVVIAIAVIITHDTEAELKNIAVAETHQGKGIAKMLIARAMEAARSSEARTMIVGTGNSSLMQLALYQKCGFRFSNIVSDFFAKYPEPIYENGIQCIDMIVLKADL